MGYTAKHDELAVVVGAEWELLGADTLKLARYWTRKVCNGGRAGRHGKPLATPAKWVPDMASDCIAGALSRYTVWRQGHRPKNKIKAIQSFIRQAAYGAVLKNLRRGESWAEVEPDTVAALPDDLGDESRLRAVLGVLEPQQAQAALALVECGSSDSAAEVLGVTGRWVRKLREQLQAAPAVEWLRGQLVADSGRGPRGALVRLVVDVVESAVAAVPSFVPPAVKAAEPCRCGPEVVELVAPRLPVRFDVGRAARRAYANGQIDGMNGVDWLLGSRVFECQPEQVQAAYAAGFESGSVWCLS